MLEHVQGSITLGEIIVAYGEGGNSIVGSISWLSLRARSKSYLFLAAADTTGVCVDTVLNVFVDVNTILVERSDDISACKRRAR